MADPERRRERITSALCVAVLHAVLAYLLVTGLGTVLPGSADQALKVFDVPAPPPPPPPAEQVEAREPAEAEEGAAAPPDLRSEPSPVAAPTPEITLPLPSPVVAAPAPGTGPDPDAGAAEIPGPGTGAGGVGTGTGAGGEGSGRGGGIAVRSRQISGRIVDDDYPRAASRAGAEGSVLVHFTVGTNGRAGGCTVIRSSGHVGLDATTCRLIEKRFRFEPARNTEGRPVPELRGWKQDWWLEAPR